MDKIKFKIIKNSDDKLISLISKWYKEEWNIEEEITIMKLDKITKSSNEFQVMMCKNIEELAAEKNMKELHLFTDTAEKLYHRMNWIKLDTLKHLDRSLVIMKKVLV